MTQPDEVQKHRHGCLAAWLVFLIIGNCIAALGYLYGSATIRQGLADAPGWAFPVLAAGCIANVAFAFALFRWKRWGFFGLVGAALLGLIVNLSVLHRGTALIGIAGVVLGLAILYWVLHMGTENKGWTQLE
jgi:hypothetical protein